MTQETLRAMRQRLGLRQREVAAAAGTTQTSVCEAERMEDGLPANPVSQKMLKRIRAALEACPDAGMVTIVVPRRVARLAGSIIFGSHGEWEWIGSVHVGPGPNKGRQPTEDELAEILAFAEQLEES